MPRPSRQSKNKTSITLDLSDVETRGRLSEGDHLLEVDEVTIESGEEHKYLKWKFKAPEEDTDPGGVVYLNTSTAPQSLWALRALLESLDIEIPDEPFDLDVAEMAGAQMNATISMEEYDGKPQPRIADHWPVEEAEQAKPAPATTKASRKSTKEETTKKTTTASAKSNGRKKAAAEAAEESVTQDEVNDMSQEELEDVIKEFELDVDLSQFKTLRKMRAATIDAAEEAKVLKA
jgi:hypothetical protein